MVKFPKLKANDLVQIVWDDAHDCGDAGRTWQERGDFSSAQVDYRGNSVGYFLKDAEGFIYIAGDVMGQFASRVFAIPRGCISSITVLMRWSEP